MLSPQRKCNPGSTNLQDISLKAVPGTMKIHQVLTELPGKISHRSLSCLCNKKICRCFEVQEFTLCSDVKQVASPQVTESTISKQTTKNEAYFEALLEDLRSSNSYKELQATCNAYRKEIGKLQLTTSPNFATLRPDLHALSLVPDDIISSCHLTPVQVTGDGDCLPRSGSVLVFGDENHPMEMRARIAIELATHEDEYLDHSFLKQGTNLTDKKAKILPTSFTMYSDHYMPGRRITKRVIREVFRKEVRKVGELRSFMGIWQLFALSNVLMKPIYSVYPIVAIQM